MRSKSVPVSIGVFQDSTGPGKTFPGTAMTFRADGRRDDRPLGLESAASALKPDDRDGRRGMEMRIETGEMAR